MEPRPEVAVLGGGVVGLSTAVYLELAGYRTTVHTERLAHERPMDPRVSSPYAAASVKPASVTMDDLSGAVAYSSTVFELLAASGTMGVRRQPHFVCHETDQPTPDYAAGVDGFVRLSEVEDHPRRPDAEAVFGWRFDAHFAEMPVYLRRLLALYRAVGGRVRRHELTRESALSLPAAVLVNCLGFHGPSLFGDPRPMEAHLGHQVVAAGLPDVRAPDGGRFSYNYTPAPGATACDGPVYAYPRIDALVLGGSRVAVDPDDGPPRDLGIPARDVDGVTLPARLLTTNEPILRSYAGVDVNDAGLTARYGYRPVRDPDGAGVRIERESIDGVPVVHNYGHGGAGVTVSWAAAARAAALVAEVADPAPGEVDPDPEFAVARELASLIRT